MESLEKTPKGKKEGKMMIKKRKKAFALAGVLLLAVLFAFSFVLSACGTTPEDSTGGGDDPSHEDVPSEYNITWSIGSDVSVRPVGAETLPEKGNSNATVTFTAEAPIFYDAAVTVNGTPIQAKGGEYSFTLGQNTTVAVSAVSNIKLHEYFTDARVPRITIATENGIALDDKSLELGYNKGLSKNIMEYDYAKATVSVSDCDDAFALTDITAKVKIRGNYSSTYPKRPLRIKFDKKQKMLGLNGGAKLKNWVLLAEYKDTSMLRTAVADYIGNSTLNGDGAYCTDFRYVEVYLNGQYNGLYTLAEQQEVKSDRVDLPEALDPDDYVDPANPTAEELAATNNTKIGYFIEYDGYYINEKETEVFQLNHQNLKTEEGTKNVEQKGYTIKSDVFCTEQQNFIKNTMQTVWDIMYDTAYNSDNRTTPYYTMNAEGEKVADETIKSEREAIERVVNLGSLVDMLILQEICEDMDIGWSSFFLSIDMSESGDRKLTFTAPWDWDSALGNRVANTQKLITLNPSLAVGSGNINPWLTVLGYRTWFWELVQERWTMMKDAGVFDGVLEMMEVMTETYAAAFATNMERWPAQLTGVDGTLSASSQQEAYNQLKTWLTARFANLETLIANKANPTA